MILSLYTGHCDQRNLRIRLATTKQWKVGIIYRNAVFPASVWLHSIYGREIRC